MKLSKAQQRAVDGAKCLIDQARAFDSFEEYEGETNHYCKARGGAEYVRANFHHFKEFIPYWEAYKRGDVLTTAGKNTIEALVKLGVFTVIEYEESRKNGVIDWVHLNNY